MKEWINKITGFLGKWGAGQGSMGDNISTAAIGEEKELKEGESRCPYCQSKKFVKRGTRKKKLEIVQLYLCRYDRLRPFALQICKPQETIEVMNMAHRQIYKFLYHRPKTILTLKEYKNRHFEPLKDYLDGVSSETPHQYFQEGLRISEIKTKFDKSQMIVRSKLNYANRLADFVLQTVKDRKKRRVFLRAHGQSVEIPEENQIKIV